jgi:biopolymer transport protein ExbD
VPKFFPAFLLSLFIQNRIEMRRYSNRTSLSTLSEINVTPLLDLAFVLLIIFMITTPLLENSKTLIIPSSATTNAPINPAAVQTLSMDRNEVVRLNEEVVDLAALEGRLAALKQADSNVAVIIRPDRTLPVQKLVSLMDALQRADITKVGIATQEEPK